MKYIDEFRNASQVRALSARISEAAEGLEMPVRFMEVCGGHTMAIHRFGIPELLPERVRLISGPGCPVCVTPTTYVDRALELADEGALLTSFGDLYPVTGSKQSLQDASGTGADVEIVYSAMDALQIAAERTERQVVFLAVGFETTAPTVAATVVQARERDIRNFRILSGHKTMPEALRTLVETPEVAIDGFILPGHVSAIIGSEPYSFLAEEFGLACCVTGFEPADILQSILVLVEQITEDHPTVANEYGRAVKPHGNPKALAMLRRVFRPVDARWRGIGRIQDSGLDLVPELSAFHCAPPNPSVPSAAFDECRCGEVLRGLISPPECPLFGTACTPGSAVGPCMVSSEGACAAHHKYGTEQF